MRRERWRWWRNVSSQAILGRCCCPRGLVRRRSAVRSVSEGDKAGSISQWEGGIDLIPSPHFSTTLSRNHLVHRVGASQLPKCSTSSESLVNVAS